MSSRTVSIRLSSELIQRIDERCVTDRCCRNDFVKNAINEALKPEPLVIKHGKILDDYGNVIGTFWFTICLSSKIDNFHKLTIPTKQPCSKCGRGTLLTSPYGKPLRVCSGCQKIEDNCKCEKK